MLSDAGYAPAALDWPAPGLSKNIGPWGVKPRAKPLPLGVIVDLGVNLSLIFHEKKGQLPKISLHVGRSLATSGNRPDKTERQQGA